MRFYPPVFFSCLLAASLSGQTPVVIGPKTLHLELGAHALFLPDTVPQLDIAEIRVLHRAGRFIPLDELRRVSDHPVREVLNFWSVFVVYNPRADTLGIVIGQTQIWWHYHSADGYTPRGRLEYGEPDPLDVLDARVTNRKAASFWIPPHTYDTVYTNVGSDKWEPALIPTVSVAPAYRAWKADEIAGANLFFGLQLGFILAALAFALLMFVQNRDRAFLWYACYCAIIWFIAWRTFEDFNPQYFITQPVLSWHAFKGAQAVLIAICYAQFVRYLLGTPERHPRLDKWLKTFIYIALATLPIDFVLFHLHTGWSRLFTNVVRQLLSLLSLGLVVSLLRTREPLALYVVAGMFCLAAGELASYWVGEAYTFHATAAGVLLEILCFIAGLSYRSRWLRDQRDAYLREKNRQERENERLQQDKLAETERLRLRIAQDIHDEVGGRLTKIALAAQVAARLPELDTAELQRRLTQLGADAQLAAAGLKEIVFAINPDYDRFSEMQAYFREVAREFWQGTDTAVYIDFPENTAFNPTVPPDVKRHLLLLFKEALNNAAKHSGATEVHLAFSITTDGQFILNIRDNGKGFVESAHTPGRSQGLSGMRKRAGEIGAVLTITSGEGEGTTVAVALKI